MSYDVTPCIFTVKTGQNKFYTFSCLCKLKEIYTFVSQYQISQKIYISFMQPWVSKMSNLKCFCMVIHLQSLSDHAKWVQKHSNTVFLCVGVPWNTLHRVPGYNELTWPVTFARRTSHPQGRIIDIFLCNLFVLR